MASPVDAGRATTGISTAADPWTVNLPASIVSGETLIAVGETGALQTIIVPAGWTSLYNGTSVIADDDICVMWRKADGTEGATFSWDMSATAKGTALVWRVTGAADPTVTPPQISTIATGTDTSPNPNSISPTGGSKDYLFLCPATCTGETQNFTAIPAGYTNQVSTNSGTGGAANTNNRMSGCSRQATTATEDPGAWTLSALPDNGWVAFVIAIHPSAPPAFVPRNPGVNHQNPAVLAKEWARGKAGVWLPPKLWTPRRPALLLS